MRPIDADALFYFLTDQLEEEVGFYSKGRNAGLNIARSALHDKTITPTITPPPNVPLTLEELWEMAWSQSPVWCSDTDGLHAGLMCIRGDWCAPGRTPHIWLLDEEGNSGVYSVKTLLKAGAVFYRRKPEEGIT